MPVQRRNYCLMMDFFFIFFLFITPVTTKGIGGYHYLTYKETSELEKTLCTHGLAGMMMDLQTDYLDLVALAGTDKYPSAARFQHARA